MQRTRFPLKTGLALSLLLVVLFDCYRLQETNDTVLVVRTPLRNGPCIMQASPEA